MELIIQGIFSAINELISTANAISTILAISFLLLALETAHWLRACSPLRIKTYDYDVIRNKNGFRVLFWIDITNPDSKMEVMVPEIYIKPILLGKEGVNQLPIKTTLQSFHPDEEPRKDGYWSAYIIKSKQTTKASVTIDIENSENLEANALIDNIWVDIHWVNYGPFGRLNLRNGSVIPIKSPEPLTQENSYFQQHKECQILPIRTHLLGSNDDIVEVISKYVAPIVQPDDVLTIGETPLAIMQGRYSHPSNIEPGIVAKVICRAFQPTSSLATACGLQALINIVGPTRVLLSFLIGFGGRLIGLKGLFYRLAGEQARLIDDITGTTPPYDQTIVLGPRNSNKLCQNISKQLGIKVAIVDVNDLGRVKILATSDKHKKVFLKKALRKNPAGNANEQTPLVLVRPYSRK